VADIGSQEGETENTQAQKNEEFPQGEENTEIKE
jgi:hypothetical protein